MVRAAALWELDGVGVHAGGRRILAPLTLALEAGRVYGLIGPNGSGKSTLMKVLARQLAPSEGAVRFAGEALGHWRGRAFARRVAYMPQFTPPTDGMSVRELVALGRYPWHGALGRFGATDAAAAEAAIRRTGLERLADRAVDGLSGGERQRAWLAVMLAQLKGGTGARCLLLDEPTSALDIAHQMELLAIVRELAADSEGLTVIVVLHDINLAARTCDHLVALRAGHMVAHGPAREMMAPATLKAVYDLPMGILPHPVSGHPMGFVL
jgi:iron complex transport system ATP-binding protein